MKAYLIYNETIDEYVMHYNYEYCTLAYVMFMNSAKMFSSRAFPDRIVKSHGSDDCKLKVVEIEIKKVGDE